MDIDKIIAIKVATIWQASLFPCIEVHFYLETQTKENNII
jgi:hypothetical protein